MFALHTTDSHVIYGSRGMPHHEIVVIFCENAVIIIYKHSFFTDMYEHGGCQSFVLKAIGAWTMCLPLTSNCLIFQVTSEPHKLWSFDSMWLPIQ